MYSEEFPSYLNLPSLSSQPFLLVQSLYPLMKDPLHLSYMAPLGTGWPLKGLPRALLPIHGNGSLQEHRLVQKLSMKAAAAVKLGSEFLFAAHKDKYLSSSVRNSAYLDNPNPICHS